MGLPYRVALLILGWCCAAKVRIVPHYGKGFDKALLFFWVGKFRLLGTAKGAE
jgi:hypothetical protein